VELDVPAASILSTFGLRARVRLTFLFWSTRGADSRCTVVLVAEHCPSGIIFRDLHPRIVPGFALLCEGKAVIPLPADLHTFLKYLLLSAFTRFVSSDNKAVDKPTRWTVLLVSDKAVWLCKLEPILCQ
jgi:hypothetical protein